jgi:multisubunit Na+/H+ antiporter MnhB subunit
MYFVIVSVVLWVVLYLAFCEATWDMSNAPGMGFTRLVVPTVAVLVLLALAIVVSGGAA